MSKELLKIEEIDGKVKVACEDRVEMAAAVGVFLYKSIMNGEKEPLLALADILCALGSLLNKRDKRRLLELIVEAVEFSKPQAIPVVPSKIKS